MKVRTITKIAVLSTILVVSKEVIAFLPNIELVTLLLILFSINMKLNESLLVSIIFCIVETLLYGMGVWVFGYFIIWPLFVILTYFIKHLLINEYRVAFYSLVFGLIFGFLFAIPYFFISFNLGLSYWMSGIVFDLIHGLSNFVISLILFKPLNCLISTRIVD